jgi:alanine racemase
MKPLIRAIVDPGALRHNLARVRHEAPGSRIMAVNKANAYGHGVVTTARALSAADAFAVARIEEGLALRAAGFGHRILLLEGVFGAEQLDAALEHRFDLMIHGFEQLQLLEARLGGRSVAAWIKIDTGMNRLGFRPEQFGEAYARLRSLPGVEADPTLVTHLACADDRANGMTPAQVTTFEQVTEGLPGSRSIANSAAVLAWPRTHADWVRPGLMLYGISPFPQGSGLEIGLQPAMALETEVIAVKAVRKGETVGYGGCWRATRETRMAVAAVGYGDGYPRGTPSGTTVQVNGQGVPLIGSVSMDMIALDVTGLPPVAVGDAVTLWGPDLPVEELARRAGTIPYELICGVSQRVHHDLR